MTEAGRDPAPSFADHRDLLVLRLRLAESGPGGVEAELRRGRRSHFRMTVDGAGLALPGDLEGATFTYGEPPVALPAELGAALVLAGSGSGIARGEPLWLEFPPPAGLLAIVPWERLLAEVDGCRKRPVLRLPYQAVPPRAPRRRRRRVLLCGSSPSAKEEVPLPAALSALAGGLASRLPPGSEVHVFTQVSAFEELEEWHRGAPEAIRAAVRLHDPRGHDFAVPPRSRSPRGGAPSPWLGWISDELGVYGADAVHFVAHGYRSGTNGALALAESPVQDRDRRLARFVWAPELAAFLNQVGAWATGFTSPRPNFSILGLRLLADRLARSRPGPVLLDEGGADGAPDPPWLRAWEAVLDGAGPLGLGTAGLRLQAHPESLRPRPEESAVAPHEPQPELPPAPDPLPVSVDHPDSGKQPPAASTPADISEAIPWTKAEEAEEAEEAAPKAPAPAEAPRWRQAGERLAEQVRSRRNLTVTDDPLDAARREGTEEALELFRTLMTEGQD